MGFLRNAWPLAAVDTDSFNLKEGKEKVLCVSAWYDNEYRRWFKIDPRIESETSEIPQTRPPWEEEGSEDEDEDEDEDETNRGPTVALVESNIYVIGGRKRDSFFFAGEVYAFNIKTGTWSEILPLNHPRAVSFVFVTGRKIYLFGTCFYRRKYMPIPIEDWIECYDLDSPRSGWESLSGPKIDEETTDRFFRGPLYAALIYQDEIRFWGPCTDGIFAFSPSSNTWSFTKAEQVQFLRDAESPTPCFNFMINHAVFGHLVLWQYRGTLYSWDLNHNTTKEVCNLEGVGVFFPERDEYDYYPGPSKFLHLGNGLLCFILWTMLDPNETQISCYNFQIDEMLPKGGLHLHAAGFHLYRVPGYGIEHAIVLSADCVGSSEDASLVKNAQLSSS